MNQITAVDVFCIFIRRAPSINIFIKISISLSILHTLTIIFDGIDQNFVQLSKFEGDCYVNSGNITITINNLCKICKAAVAVRFFVFIIFFTVQATKESIVSIEFDTISIVICAIQSGCNHKFNTNINTSRKLNEKRNVAYTLNNSITIAFIIANYYTLATKICQMDQLYATVDKTLNFDIFITIVNVFHTIAHQIEILMVVYIIIHETSLFIVTHGTFMLICALSAHSNATSLFWFYLIMNNMDILNMSVYN